MPIEIGKIEALFRYPVKSMRGEQLDATSLGWHGIEGDIGDSRFVGSTSAAGCPG